MGCRVLGFWFWISDFGLRVLRSGFRVSDFLQKVKHTWDSKIAALRVFRFRGLAQGFGARAPDSSDTPESATARCTLPIETKVESKMSQSKSGTFVDLSDSEFRVPSFGLRDSGSGFSTQSDGGVPGVSRKDV